MTRAIEYPKYPEELNRRIKLTEADRALVKQMAAEKVPLTEIAKMFNVTPSCINGALKSKEELAKRNRASYLKRRRRLQEYYQRPDVKDRQRENEARKRELQGEEVQNYYNSLVNRWRKNGKKS